MVIIKPRFAVIDSGTSVFKDPWTFYDLLQIPIPTKKSFWIIMGMWKY